MRLLITDTETVGLNAPAQPASGIVEVAYLEIDTETLEITDEFYSRINPGCAIDPRASAVHGISDADVANSPSMAEAFEVKGAVINCGHNSAFDVKFLAPYYENLAGSLCTLALARQYIKDSDNHKLGTLIKHLGLPAGEAHNALADCHMTWHLLRHIVDMSGRSLSAHIAAARKPKILHIFPFGKHKGQKLTDIPGSYALWLLSQSDLDQDIRYSLSTLAKSKGY